MAVRDAEGNSYAAMVDDTSSTECVIDVPGLVSGRAYTFVLGGLIPVETGVPTTVKGYFETPEIAAALETGDDEEDDDEDDDPEETPGRTEEESDVTEGSQEPEQESTSQPEPETRDDQEEEGADLE